MNKIVSVLVALLVVAVIFVIGVYFIASNLAFPPGSKTPLPALLIRRHRLIDRLRRLLLPPAPTRSG